MLAEVRDVAMSVRENRDGTVTVTIGIDSVTMHVEDLIPVTLTDRVRVLVANLRVAALLDASEKDPEKAPDLAVADLVATAEGRTFKEAI